MWKNKPYQHKNNPHNKGKMRHKTKKRITGFFKRPLVILIIIVIGWALFAGLSTSFIISRATREAKIAALDLINDIKGKVDRGRTVLEDVDIYNLLSVVDIGIDDGNILSGTVVNASDKKLGGLKLKLIFLDREGKTSSIQEFEDVIKVIGPNSSVKFTVRAEPAQYARVKGIVSDFYLTH